MTFCMRPDGLTQLLQISRFVLDGSVGACILRGDGGGGEVCKKGARAVRNFCNSMFAKKCGHFRRTSQSSLSSSYDKNSHLPALIFQMCRYCQLP